MRLRGRGVISAIFSDGKGLRAGQLVLKYRVYHASNTNVCAAFVTRRSAGSAPRRNKLRRLLREAYRVRLNEFCKGLPAGVKLHLVFLWAGNKEQATKPRLDGIGKEMDRLLERLGTSLKKEWSGEHQQ